MVAEYFRERYTQTYWAAPGYYYNDDYTDVSFAADLFAGVNLWDMVDISYTFRLSSKSLMNKFSIGYTYRFK